MRACIPLEIIHVGFFDLLVDYLVRAQEIVSDRKERGYILTVSFECIQSPWI